MKTKKPSAIIYNWDRKGVYELQSHIYCEENLLEFVTAYSLDNSNNVVEDYSKYQPDLIISFNEKILFNDKFLNSRYIHYDDIIDDIELANHIVKQGTFINCQNPRPKFSIFTSTYDTYLVVMEDMINSAGGILYLQMRYGSNTETSANYLGTSTTWASSSQQNLNSSSTTQSSVQTMHAGQKTSFAVYFNQVGNASESPMWHGSGYSGGYNVPYFYGCVLYSARTYTGIFLSSSTGNMTGTFSIYGLAKA